MTIDEAIKFCHEKSENIKLKAEPQVFIDIAEWLEELKEYKATNYPKCSECAGCTQWNCDCANVRDKAIDDMEKAILDSLPVVEKDKNVSLIGCVADVCIIVGSVAKQLKDGGKDE